MLQWIFKFAIFSRGFLVIQLFDSIFLGSFYAIGINLAICFSESQNKNPTYLLRYLVLLTLFGPMFFGGNNQFYGDCQ